MLKIAGSADSYIQIKNSLHFVSFISLIIYTHFVFKRVNIAIGALFLLNPVFIYLIVDQVRMGFAFALLVLIFTIKNKYLTSLLVIASVLIHTVSLLFVFIYFYIKKLPTLLHNRRYYAMLIIAAFVLMLFLKYGVYHILEFIGDRRVGIVNTASSSIKFSIFWFYIVILLTCKVQLKNNQINYIVAFYIFMASLFFFSTIFGFYGQRFIAVSIPMLIVSIGYLPNYYKLTTYILLFLFTIIQWFYVFGIFPI